MAGDVPQGPAVTPEEGPSPDPTGEAFVDESRRLLAGTYLPRLRACLERLSEEEVWWRPNEASNSVGVLVLHLCGNVRQWVVSGLGGAPDRRERAAEFAGRDRLPVSGLLDRLDATVREVDATLAALDPEVLHRRLVVQGTEVTGLQALYHAVEHFSMHTGQILWITKLRLGEDLGFYRVEDGVATPTWGAGGHR